MKFVFPTSFQIAASLAMIAVVQLTSIALADEIYYETRVVERPDRVERVIVKERPVIVETRPVIIERYHHHHHYRDHSLRHAIKEAARKIDRAF